MTTALLILAVLMLVREWMHMRDRDQHRAEIQTLLQRIQAPIQAVIEHAAQGARNAGSVPPDDDDAWHDYREEQAR